MSSFRNYSLFPRLRIRSSVFWANSSFFVSERAIFFMIPYFLDLLQDLEPFHFRHRVIIIFPLTWDCNTHASLGPWTIPLTRDLEPFHFWHGVIVISFLPGVATHVFLWDLEPFHLPGTLNHSTSSTGHYNLPSYLGLQLMSFSGTLNHSTSGTGSASTWNVTKAVSPSFTWCLSIGEWNLGFPPPSGKIGNYL